MSFRFSSCPLPLTWSTALHCRTTLAGVLTGGASSRLAGSSFLYVQLQLQLQLPVLPRHLCPRPVLFVARATSGRHVCADLPRYPWVWPDGLFTPSNFKGLLRQPTLRGAESCALPFTLRGKLDTAQHIGAENTQRDDMRAGQFGCLDVSFVILSASLQTCFSPAPVAGATSHSATDDFFAGSYDQLVAAFLIFLVSPTLGNHRRGSFLSASQFSPF